MRRLADERGATAVLVAILIMAPSVLFGFAAFAVDVGALYQERRELQNGADAAALAVAQECAEADLLAAGLTNLCAFSPDPIPTQCLTGTSLVDGLAGDGLAEQYADANANDRASDVECLMLDLTEQSVTVTTRTEVPPTSTNTPPSYALPHWFAPLIGNQSSTVRARATAMWGYPASLTVVPFAMSICDWNEATTNGVNYADSPPYPPYPSNPESIVQVLVTGGPAASICTHNGQDFPGGFGWLEPDTPTSPPGCYATVDANTTETQGGTGAGPPTPPGSDHDCSASWFANNVWQNRVYIPVYDYYSGNGSNGDFHIAGFAAFYVTGYELTGQHKKKSVVTNVWPCGTAKCFSGYFIEQLIPVASFGGPNFGVISVGLTN